MFAPRRLLRLLAAALVLPLVAACIESPEEVQLAEVSCAFAFGLDTTQMTKTSSGLFYRDLSVGSGEVVNQGDETYVYYSLWSITGQLYEAALPTNSDPFGFFAGAGQTIRGFDEGVQGMRVGGCRRLAIPPSLGYGNAPSGAIPANSWLVFEVGVAGAF
ncbi:MAG TPA: FKBP-type peptidyl-prolyl cis-trans isomerase [Gemmatimonadaceae bacterium]|nr:FKBP-type peptidyl-prolyl cis-trans isomerase [Gemmatimonadaceae bacterium]